MAGGVFGGWKKYSRSQEKRQRNSWWRDHGGVVRGLIKYYGLYFATHNLIIASSIEENTNRRFQETLLNVYI
jgi:hypothetical protein